MLRWGCFETAYFAKLQCKHFFFFAFTCHFVRSLGAHDGAGATRRSTALHNLSKVVGVSVKFWIRTVYLWNPRLPPPKDVAANTNEGLDLLRIAPITRPSCLQPAIKTASVAINVPKFRTSTAILLGEHIFWGSHNISIETPSFCNCVGQVFAKRQWKPS